MPQNDSDCHQNKGFRWNKFFLEKVPIFWVFYVHIYIYMYIYIYVASKKAQVSYLRMYVYIYIAAVVGKGQDQNEAPTPRPVASRIAFCLLEMSSFLASRSWTMFTGVSCHLFWEVGTASQMVLGRNRKHHDEVTLVWWIFFCDFLLWCLCEEQNLSTVFADQAPLILVWSPPCGAHMLTTRKIFLGWRDIWNYRPLPIVIIMLVMLHIFHKAHQKEKHLSLVLCAHAADQLFD